MSRRLALAALAAALAAGCRPPGLYDWNGYDDALYRHYRNPQDRSHFIEVLRTTVADAETRGVRVPPGISAELGYALYEENQPAEAIPWFEREWREWPESGFLMQKMVRNARLKAGQGPPPPATGPAGATEVPRS